MVIDSPAGWRGGYRIAFGIQLSIALLLFCTLPLWKKAHGREEADTGQAATVLSLREIARIPGVKEMWCLFITSCGIEYTCGNWGSTFLVEARQMTADQAAGVVVFYYVGMALGRLISGLLASRFHSWKIIRMGQLVLGAALIVLLLPGSPYASAAGLFLVGLGNGPLFPNFNYLTPENFGAKVSQSVMGTQMAVSYVGIMLVPALFGALGQWAGVRIFPAYLLVFYVIMLVMTGKVKKHGKPGNNSPYFSLFPK